MAQRYSQTSAAMMASVFDFAGIFGSVVRLFFLFLFVFLFFYDYLSFCGYYPDYFYDDDFFFFIIIIF